MLEAPEQEAAPRRSGGKTPEAFRTISEVADDLDVPQHVLRFWETRFPQIRPLKRGGGRRYYRPADIALLKAIRGLLYDDGYTIKGVQKLIRTGGVKSLLQPKDADDSPVPELASSSPTQQELDLGDPRKEALREIIKELEAIRDLLAAKD